MATREDLRIPLLDNVVTVGGVTRWLAVDGERVQPGDVVAEVRVGRAETDVVVQRTGRLRHLVSVAAHKPVGTAIARVVDAEFGAGSAPADSVAPAGVPGRRHCEFVLRPRTTDAHVVSAVNAVVAPRAEVVRAQRTGVAGVDYPPLPAGCEVAVGVGAVTERVVVVSSPDGTPAIAVRPTVTIGLTYSAAHDVEALLDEIGKALPSMGTDTGRA